MNRVKGYLIGTNKNTGKSLLLGILSTEIVVLAYNLIFFNKYFPITEGWFSVYGELIRRGHTPYTDFHLVLPPLYPSIIALIFTLFGQDFIVLRLIGILLILLFALFFFLLLSRVFPSYIAAIAVITGVIYYQAGTAHITYDFIQFFSTFVVISAYLLCLHNDCNRSTLKNQLNIKQASYLILAGFFCALAVLTKQSNGLVLLIFFTFSILLTHRGKRGYYTLKASGTFLCGAGAPIAVMILLLYSKGALSAFINQALIGASASKGSLGAILTGWIPRIIYIDQISNFIFVCALLYILGYRFLAYRIIFNDSPAISKCDAGIRYWPFFSIALAGLLAIYMPFVNVDMSKWAIKNTYFIFGFYSIIITVLLGSILISFLYIISTLFFRQTSYLLRDDAFLISMTSLGFLLGTATSGGIAEAGSFLGFSFILGYLLCSPSHFNIGRYFFLVCAFFLIIFCASRKYTAPYNWWWIAEPDIRSATVRPTLPLLKGFYLSGNTVDVIQDITKLLEKYTVTSDEIFSYPNVPLFYILANRIPQQFIFIHWYDVLPDYLAIAEANRITKELPKIIIHLRLKEEVAKGHEMLFRENKISGQRAITQVIDSLTHSGAYLLEKSYLIPQENVLEVWRRKPLQQ